MINELQNRGYTKNGIGGAVSSKLVYVDYDGEDVIEIFDFTVDNIHLYYKAFVNGDRVVHCKQCGKVTIPNGNRTEYCEHCGSTTERKRRQRNEMSQ